MHRVRVFLNGAASSSRSHDWKGELQRGLFRSEVSFVSSPNREEFEQELRRAAEEKIDVVVSVGGDGTFNTLLQQLKSTETSFLVVPAGTANDLARELGVTRKLRTAIECIRRDEVQTIDLISINGRPMATNGGIGLVSDVALSINTWRKKIPAFQRLMGGVHHRVYSMGLGVHLLANRFHRYQVSVESEEYSGEITTPLLLINNQPNIAGTFPVAPATRNDDGSFNVTFFLHESWAEFVAAVLRVKRGLPVDHDPKIVSFESRRTTIHSLEPDVALGFFGDGEHLVRASSLEARIQPKALKVFRPFCRAKAGAAVEPLELDNRKQI